MKTINDLSLEELRSLVYNNFNVSMSQPVYCASCGFGAPDNPATDENGAVAGFLPYLCNHCDTPD